MNKNNSWTGTQFYCPLCSSNLIEDPEVEEEEFDWGSDDDYDVWLKTHPENNDDSAHYHCSSEKCIYHSNALRLFHPLGSFSSKAGDSWALGDLNNWWNGIIHCAFCGHHLINDKNNDYHCSNGKCFYDFKYSLTLFHPKGAQGWAIGYIK